MKDWTTDFHGLQFRIERGLYQADREVIFLSGNLKLFKELNFSAETKLVFFYFFMWIKFLDIYISKYEKYE